MVTQVEGKRLKEAYRLALSAGNVAHYREWFRLGRTVRFRIDDETGFSDGVGIADRMALAGEYQLRHHGHKSYGVFGRLDGSTDGWIMVDGPWRIGDGPFDKRGGGLAW